MSIEPGDDALVRLVLVSRDAVTVAIEHEQLKRAAMRQQLGCQLQRIVGTRSSAVP